MSSNICPQLGGKDPGELVTVKGFACRAPPLLSCAEMGGSWAVCLLQLVLLPPHKEG